MAGIHRESSPPPYQPSFMCRAAREALGLSPWGGYAELVGEAELWASKRAYQRESLEHQAGLAAVMGAASTLHGSWFTREVTQAMKCLNGPY